MKIVLIEPDKVLAGIYSDALLAEGHQVLAFADGQSAMNACDRAVPDLVIVELQLPKHNGVEFLYEFRSYPEWFDVPIIILSVIPATEISWTVLYEQLGIAGYYYKPRTKLAALTAAVAELPAAVTA